MSTRSVPVALQRLDEGLPVPRQARVGDAGVDLHAREGLTLRPGQRALVPTGIAIALPEGYAGFVHPRSGLAARHGITIVNAPGLIDSGYRGEILINLLNTDVAQPVTVQRGDRIAQLVVQQVVTPVFDVVQDLPDSERGTGGHGHTGTGTGELPHDTTSDTDPKD